MKKRWIALLILFAMMMAGAGAQAVPADPLYAAPADTDRILSEMTLEEKVAQMFLVRCLSSGAIKQIQAYQPGGYILFAEDFEGETVDSTKEKIAGYQAASKLPMLIGVDEEGGTVTRVSRFPAFRDEKFQSPRALFSSGGIPLIVEDAREKSILLRELGVNFNLAPVADVAVNSNDFMYSRSLGQDAETTALYVASVVGAMNELGMASALKHFPGYGDNRDTHNGIAVDKRPYAQFEQVDFVPFAAGVRAGAGCILVSHNVVECMDKERPASLSSEVHRVLREELGFEGVIMTDDLYMGAIKQYTGTGAAAVLAVEAGNDLLCATDFETQYKAVLSAVESGRIDEARIDASVRRLLDWKQSMGII